MYVNGTRDLIDFFPVQIDLTDMLTMAPAGQYTYKLKHKNKSSISDIKIVETDLRPEKSGKYLKPDGTSEMEYVIALGKALKHPVNANGYLLSEDMLMKIRDGKSIILVEGVYETTNSLELEISRGGTKVFSTSLKLSIAGVEQMFRHKNLIHEMHFVQNPPEGYTPPQGIIPIPGHPVPLEGEGDRLTSDHFSNPLHFTGFDADNSLGNFVHVHGFNVNAKASRGEQTELFKRLYWSGSKARFWGITWYGYDSQLMDLKLIINGIETICLGQRTLNYHVNVRHAFNAGKLLMDFVNNDANGPGGSATFSAHSLGNMVISTAIQNSMKYGRYLMVNPAVAEEAYVSESSYRGASWDSATRPLMYNPDWRYPDGKESGYTRFLWASEWYTLFGDERNKLTWRNYFSKVREGNDKGKVYTFFATTDEAFRPFPLKLQELDSYSDVSQYPKNNDVSKFLTIVKSLYSSCSDPEQLGNYSFSLQEMMKGTELTPILSMDNRYGGWGFNLADYYLCPEQTLPGEMPNCAIIAPGEANTLDRNLLKARPLFSKNPDNASLFTNMPVDASVLTTPMKERLLANEIPALTFAVGHWGVDTYKPGTNFDIRQKYVRGPLAPWPRKPTDRYEWRHSDIFNVAYPYLYRMYDDWVVLLSGGVLL
jgi:hypothetical protein